MRLTAAGESAFEEPVGVRYQVTRLGGMDLGFAVDFAAGHRNSVLTNVETQRCRPQLSNVVYAIDGGVVRVSITATLAKHSNLSRDPRIGHARQ